MIKHKINTPRGYGKFDLNFALKESVIWMIHLKQIILLTPNKNLNMVLFYILFTDNVFYYYNSTLWAMVECVSVETHLYFIVNQKYPTAKFVKKKVANTMIIL